MINIDDVKQFSWADAYNNSLLSNSQLVFNNKLTLNICNTYDKDSVLNEYVYIGPSSELFDCYFNEYTSNSYRAKEIRNCPIVLMIDNRTDYFRRISSLEQKSLFSIVHYFPLTKDKFRMNCYSKIIDIKQNRSKNDLEAIASSLNNLSIDNKYDKSIIDDYFNLIESTISKEGTENIINFYWKLLNEEEKLIYESLSPDTYKPKENLSDIDKFESQEKEKPIDNFSLIFLFPYIIEHTVYPKTQVIANTRKQNFESLYKPRKMCKKNLLWLNLKDKTKAAWEIKELNI
jgi:hypothetical protein